MTVYSQYVFLWLIVDSPVEQPVFKLHKWATSESDGSKSVSREPVSEDDKLSPSQTDSSPIHHNASSENSGQFLIVTFSQNQYTW